MYQTMNKVCLGLLSTLVPALAFAQETPEPPAEAEPAEAEPAPENEESETQTILTFEASDAPMWKFALAPRIGLAVPTSRLDAFVSMGLEFSYRLPVLEGHLALTGDLAYTKPSHSAQVNDARVGGDAGYAIDESEFKLGLGASYRLFKDHRKISPWIGGSLILQRLRSTETNDLSPGENTSTDMQAGAELALGTDYRIGPGYALGELRIPFTDLDHLITGNSNAGNVNLSVGYRLVF